MKVLLSGMVVAGSPGQGRATWPVLRYLLGRKELGHEVFLLEAIAKADP